MLVSIDTLRADHLGCYGYERDTSPRIDAFAARGTLFENALSSASWTVPAHMTMLTGLGARAHGLLAYPRPGRLAPGFTTLAERLRAEGFRTAAFTGGGFVSPVHGFDDGFEVFEPRSGTRFGGGRGDLQLTKTVPEALDWLATVGEEERFFLFVHGFDAHGPYEPPPDLDRYFDPDYRGDYDTSDFAPGAPRPSDEDLRHVVAQYDASIRSADREVGRLLDGLEAAGRLSDTLVVITSDHGEEMYEHGSVEHTHSLYEELVRVPLVLVGPGVPARREPRQVGLVDVYPTALGALGVALHGTVQGRDLLAPGPHAPVFSFVDFSLYPYRLASVRTDRWKLIDWTLAGMAGVEVRPNQRYARRFRDRAEDWVELYDLEADPGERRDVSAEHPRVVAELRALLRERMAESAAIRRDPLEEGPADPEYLRDLEALGYAK